MMKRGELVKVELMFSTVIFHFVAFYGGGNLLVLGTGHEDHC